MKKNHIKIFISLILCILSTIGVPIRADKTQLEANMTSNQQQVYNSLSLDKQMEIVAVYDSKTRTHNYKENEFNDHMNSIRNFLSSESDPIIRLKKSFIIGMVFLDDGSFLVNVSHFKIISGRCKSSINSHLQRMGLITYRQKMDPKNESPVNHIKLYFSSLFNGQYPRGVVRQWTKRSP